MITQFFILSLRGDILSFRDFRGLLGRHTTDVFFRRVKTPTHGISEEPIFHVDGIQYVHIQKNGMYFVFTAVTNISPSLAIDLLESISKTVRDYCGILTEEAIRKNFMLVYELIDEMMDFGYPEQTASDYLKSFITSTPVLTDIASRPLLSNIIREKTTSSKSANQSIALLDFNKKDEIFVDIQEDLTVHFGPGGQVLVTEIVGSFVLKSFIKGKPKIRMGLNDDLIVGRKEGRINYGNLVLDQCTFHECVKFEDWESERVLNFYPPEGEFLLLNYRSADDFVPPYKLFTILEEPGPMQLDIIVKIIADYPPNIYGNDVVMRVPVPKSTISASCEIERPMLGFYEFNMANKQFVWNIGKVQGRVELSIRIKLNMDKSDGNVKREVGPITMDFVIPHWIFGLRIKSFKVMMDDKEMSLNKWVRPMSQAASFQVRVDSKNVLNPNATR